MKRRWKIVRRILAIGALCALALVDYSTDAVEQQNRGALFDNTATFRTGASRLFSVAPRFSVMAGQIRYFVNRMEAAAAVFKAGKADYLLVSGDNHTAGYDEPTAMKDALVRLGVPEERIALDYAGFSTSDSVLRAKLVFGLTQFSIISQRDHALRAIYIANHHHLDAVGFAAEDVPGTLRLEDIVTGSLRPCPHGAGCECLGTHTALHRPSAFPSGKTHSDSERMGIVPLNHKLSRLRGGREHLDDKPAPYKDENEVAQQQDCRFEKV